MKTTEKLITLKHASNAELRLVLRYLEAEKKN